MKILDRLENFKNWGAIGIILALVLLIWLSVYGLFLREFSWDIDFKFLTIFATCLGGFSTFLSIILLYAALNRQSRFSRLTQIENKFFSQVQYHRDNVSQMKYKIPSQVKIIKSPSGEFLEPVVEEGGRVFIEIHKQIITAKNKVDKLLRDKSIGDIYGNCSMIQLKEKLPVDLRVDDKLKELAIIDIAYLSVFFVDISEHVDPRKW